MTKLNRKEEYIVYTVLIENDNTVRVTERQRIMQCSKLVDVLQIVVPKVYNDLDISQCVAKLEYLTPINHNHGFIELEISYFLILLFDTSSLDNLRYETTLPVISVILTFLPEG